MISYVSEVANNAIGSEHARENDWVSVSTSHCAYLSSIDVEFQWAHYFDE